MTEINKQQDFRSTLAQVKGLGSAHEGVHQWIGQRLSAIGIIPLGVILLLWLLAFSNDSYLSIIYSLSSPWVATVFFLFIACVSYHGALGLQVVIEDYAHTPFWRYWLIIKVKIMAFFLPVLSLFFLIKIMMMGNTL